MGRFHCFIAYVTPMEAFEALLSVCTIFVRPFTLPFTTVCYLSGSVVSDFVSILFPSFWGRGSVFRVCGRFSFVAVYYMQIALGFQWLPIEWSLRLCYSELLGLCEVVLLKSRIFLHTGLGVLWLRMHSALRSENRCILLVLQRSAQHALRGTEHCFICVLL